MTPKRKAAAKRAPAKRKSTSSKLYKIYDMENGGRLLKVRKDDPRYLEEDDALMEGRLPRYPHRKPSATARKQYQATELIGGSPIGKIIATPEAQKIAGAVAIAAAPRATRTVAKLAGKLAQAVTATRITVGGAALSGAASAGVVGLLAAAGIGSYFATRYIIDNFPTRQRRLDAAATAYRQARRDLAAKLGRELNAGEQKALADHYKSVVAGINKSPV